MRDYNYCRVTSTLLGLTCAGLGSYGAFEFAYKLERTMSYLVIAAPVVAVTAALIPPIAEATWRAGGYVKALLWWAVLVPAGAVVFFSAAERVHDAKAGQEAERGAFRSAAARASAALTKAEAELVMVRAAANKARGQKQCGPECRTKLAAEAAAQADLEAAKQSLLRAEQKATTASPLKAPVWLLPAALDVVAFMGIWTALSGPKKVPLDAPQGKSKTRARPRRPRATPASRQQRAANDNGVYLPAA